MNDHHMRPKLTLRVWNINLLSHKRVGPALQVASHADVLRGSSRVTASRSWDRNATLQATVESLYEK